MVVGPSSVSWLSSLECEKFDIYGLGNNGEGEKGGGKEAEIVRTAIALFSSSVQMSCRVVISVRWLGEEEGGGAKWDQIRALQFRTFRSGRMGKREKEYNKKILIFFWPWAV